MRVPPALMENFIVVMMASTTVFPSRQKYRFMASKSVGDSTRSSRYELEKTATALSPCASIARINAV